MNTFRKIKHNAKALSPVVASIILIAVTVAVSVAVAAWMGGMTLGFMNTEQLKITNVGFNAADEVDITLQNTGSSPVTITDIYIQGGAPVAVTYPSTSPQIGPKLAANEAVTATATFTWTNGATYLVKVVTSAGNSFTYQASAPSA